MFQSGSIESLLLIKSYFNQNIFSYEYLSGDEHSNDSEEWKILVVPAVSHATINMDRGESDD